MSDVCREREQQRKQLNKDFAALAAVYSTRLCSDPDRDESVIAASMQALAAEMCTCYRKYPLLCGRGLRDSAPPTAAEGGPAEVAVQAPSPPATAAAPAPPVPPLPPKANKGKGAPTPEPGAEETSGERKKREMKEKRVAKVAV